MSAVASNISNIDLWSPSKGFVLDRAGRPVDTSGTRWRLHDPLVRIDLDWDKVKLPVGEILNALRRYFAWLITVKQPSSVKNAFAFLQPFISAGAFQRAATNNDVVPYLAFSQTRDALGQTRGWQLHYARQFYRWCVSQGLANFPREVLDRADDLVVGGNLKGQAVRSRDPNRGPLDAQEVAALTVALRAMRAEGAMPIKEQAAVWLALAVGSNPGQFASLREEDVVVEKIDGTVAAWIVRVPRHKKGDVLNRSSFRERRVDRFIGTILDELISHNARLAPQSADQGSARPLFRRATPEYDNDDPLFEWTWHLGRNEFTALIKKAVKRLRVRSRTGGPLNVSTRRFRYSLATRLINNGASTLAVADALDHSDTQNVGVYFDVHSDIVEHLDRAMALALAPRAQAFATIVRSEAEATNGEKKGSRRYFSDRDKEIFEPIGTCGSNSFCNINAPLACYTCIRFQAWMDGPHDLILDSLLLARERRAALGLSPKMVGVEDQLIAAVANVIIRIAEMEAMGG